MFDMRYHIASLVAVFLALTVGIVLGTAIVNRGVLVKQQTALVSGLRQEFATLRDRNRVLQDAVNDDEQFFETALPILVDKRLAGKRVAVVASDSQDTADLRQAVIALRQAGARVSIVTVLSPDLGTKNDSTAAKLQRVFLREKLSGEDLRRRLLSEIATQIATSTEPAFINQLTDIGVIKATSIGALPAQAVVFTAGSGEKEMISQVQVPLIEALKSTKAQLVGVEAGGIEESAMSTYRGAGAGTIDNIDTPIGEVSLVFSLSGLPGHYGVKPTADALAPKLEAR